MDRTRFVIPLGDAQLLGFPDGETQDPGGGRRGGYIGLGKAEKNLVHRGFEAILVEMVIKSWLHSIRKWQEGRLKRHGVRLALNDGVAGLQTGATRC